MAFPELPFHQDVSARFLPWMVGLILYVVIFAFWGVLWLSTGDGPQVHRVTVDVPTSVPESLIPPLLQVLQGAPGVVDVHPVSAQELQEELEPWLLTDEAEAVLKTLPCPRLIDLTFHHNPRDTLPALEVSLQNFGSDIVLLPWGGGAASPARMASWMGIVCAGLLIFTMLGVVVLTVRTSLLIYRPVLEILVLMGAAQRYILGHFLVQSLKNAVLSAILASLLFGGTVWVFGFQGFVMLPKGREWMWAGYLSIVPLLGVLTIGAATVLTVSFSLKRGDFSP